MAISSNRMGLKKFAENIKKLKETGSMGDYQSEESKQARATVASKKKTPTAAPKRSNVGLDVGKKPAATVKKGQDVISDKMSFGKAFRAARNEGMKTFTWRGKKYGTKLKSEVKKKESTPKAKAAPATQLLPDVATSQRAEQKKAREEAVKGVEQNIAASTSQKPAVDTKKSQIEKVKKAIATIDKSISQMQNNPSGYFGLLSGKQKNQRIKLRKRKEMLQKKLKNLS